MIYPSFGLGCDYVRFHEIFDETFVFKVPIFSVSSSWAAIIDVANSLIVMLIELKMLDVSSFVV